MTQEPNSHETSPEKAPFSEQLADIVLKVVMTGGIAGGGLGAVWSLVQESNIPKAIASAVIGLGISYGAKLLQPVHEGNQQRLEKTGKAIDAAIEQTTEKAIAKVTGKAEQYFRCQAWASRRFRSEGVAQYDRIFTPLLEEVFVPLALAQNALQAGYRAEQLEIDPEQYDEGFSIWKLLVKAKQEPVFRQIVILAWGGYGKTTLLKHIAYTYGMNQQGKYEVPRKIPVLLVLRKYRQLLAQPQPPTLPQLIHEHHLPSLPESDQLKLPATWAEAMLRRGDAIVMLDGFDEVAKDQRPAVARWINQQMQRYHQSVFILTSRPKAFQDQVAADRLEFSTLLWVRDFNADQRRQFVEQWYFCQERYANGGDDTPDVRQIAQQASNQLLAQIEAREELRDLAKNPLLLNMIVTFHRRFPGAKLPQRRVELYQEICQLQLRDRPGARELETALLQCQAQTILQMLALEMMQLRYERLSRTELLQRLDQYLKAQSESIEAPEFLEQVVQISELLVPQEDEYEFAHLSFQEYLAAAEIARLPQESMLYERFQDDWWKSTILLYAAQINPTGLMREMLNRDAIDLAYRCWQETTRRIDPALVSEIQLRRVEKLEAFLRNQEWEKADNETYRLMITTVGKDKGEWFTSDELLNFPCAELKAIDGLWVKYSQGRFGFSVQKELYLECGGIPDGQYHKEAWDTFCHANGWKVNNQYAGVTFDTTSPKAHLPSLGVLASLALVRHRHWGIPFLCASFFRIFSRIETCEL
jgi:hypothetical protein